MGVSDPPLTTTHMGSPHPHQTPHTSSYSSADTPIFDPNPLPRGPVVQGFGLDVPLSRPDRAFQWRQVDPSPNDSPNPPCFSLQDMQAFSSAQPTSATKWSDSTFLSVDLAAGDPNTAKLASDREVTQAQAPPLPQRRTQTESRKYMDEMVAALSCRPHPMKLSADMHRMLHASKPVHSPQELQCRLESTGSQTTKYQDQHRPHELQQPSESFGSPAPDHSDWYRHSTSPAATTVTSGDEGHGLATCDAKLTLNGFGGCGSGRAGAQGPLTAGRAVGDLSGLSWGKQPSIGTLHRVFAYHEPRVQASLEYTAYM